MRISSENVKVTMGTKQILHGITMDSDGHQFVGLIGPNGSGKSTFLKCVYRVLKPNEGAVFLDHEPLSTMHYKDSAKKLGVVAQHNYYNFEFTVREVALMGRAPHKRTLERDSKEDYEIVDDALRRVEMYDMADRQFSTLSGGEQQRVILARALAQKTPCLILDEPTNHLDITHQLSLLRLVKGLDVTIVSAIHDLNIAAAFCDYIYVLKDGEIVTHGKTEDVLTVETIRNIYGVETEIVTDSKGHMHILFVN